MTFGLSVSQDIFQAKLDEILNGLNTITSIANDIRVGGDMEEMHDCNLATMMECAVKYGLVLNYKKCDINVHCIKFFGLIYSDQGIKPDPSKIENLTDRKFKKTNKNS